MIIRGWSICATQNNSWHSHMRIVQNATTNNWSSRGWKPATLALLHWVDGTCRHAYSDYSLHIVIHHTRRSWSGSLCCTRAHKNSFDFRKCKISAIPCSHLTFSVVRVRINFFKLQDFRNPLYFHVTNAHAYDKDKISVKTLPLVGRWELAETHNRLTSVRITRIVSVLHSGGIVVSVTESKPASNTLR